MKINAYITPLTQMAPLVLTSFLAYGAANISSSNQLVVADNTTTTPIPWWKNAVFYQIYIRSFKDSNGDGVGDFNGIIDKLDYIQQLGVDTLLISPHYDSPNVDNGYDIRDYKQVMKEFGTMADFDRLMIELKRRQMRLIIDIVANHTSDSHEWFKNSQKSVTNPYRDFYFWRDPNNNHPPNNYISIFGGSAWQFDPTTGQYYLHYFSKHQPDINWDNPNVREAIYDAIGFWLDKGVSGLRFDSIPTISKFTDFPMLKDPEFIFSAYNNGPNLHRYLKEMHQRFKPNYEIVTMGEMAGVKDNDIYEYVSSAHNELDMAIDLNLFAVGRDPRFFWKYNHWTVKQFCRVIDNLQQATETPWTSFFLTNHDNSRALSFFGVDHGRYRIASAKALATITLTQRATPVIYQGEEIGMTNYPFQSIDEFNDLRAHQDWETYVLSGKIPSTTFIQNLSKTSRDNSRTPFQWDNSAQAGFTTATPWMKVNPNYPTVNAKAEVSSPSSIFHYYRELIALRHRIPALVVGSYNDISKNNRDIYAYTRTLNDDIYLVVVNFSNHPHTFKLTDNNRIAAVLIESSPSRQPLLQQSVISLKPWQSGIYRLRRTNNRPLNRLMSFAAQPAP